MVEHLSYSSISMYLDCPEAWRRIDFKTACHMAVKWRGGNLRDEGNTTKHAPRVESVWINPRADEMMRSGSNET